MRPARIAGAFIVVVGLGFGAMGGEYSTPDWWTLRQQVAEEDSAITRLKVEIDSLSKAAKSLEVDPATQERTARESFGMIRPGEVEYRVEGRAP